MAEGTTVAEKYRLHFVKEKKKKRKRKERKNLNNTSSTWNGSSPGSLCKGMYFCEHQLNGGIVSVLSAILGLEEHI